MTNLHQTSMDKLKAAYAGMSFSLNDSSIAFLIEKGYLQNTNEILTSNPPRKKYNVTEKGLNALATQILAEAEVTKVPFVFDRDLHLGILHRVFCGEVHSTYGDSVLHGLMKEGYIINVNVCGAEGSTHTVSLTRKGIDELIAWAELREAACKAVIRSKQEKLSEIDDYISRLNNKKSKLP